MEEDKETIKLWNKYFKSRSKKTRDEIFTKYLPFANSVAVNYLKNHKSSSKFFLLYKNDAYTWAQEGLLTAIERYDLDHSAKFQTFAKKRIWGNIIDGYRRIGFRSRRKWTIIEKSLAECEAFMDQGGDEEDITASYFADKEKEYDELDIEEWLNKMKNDLNFDDRTITILRLRYVHNFTLAQIAQVLGCNESRVSQLLNNELMPILRDYYTNRAMIL